MCVGVGGMDYDSSKCTDDTYVMDTVHKLAQSSLLSSLATSPTSQLSCFLIVSIVVQHSSTFGYHFRRLGALDIDKFVR